MEDSKKYVLIVEDDKFLANIYNTKLDKEGFVAEVAENGEIGLELMRSRKPVLVLLDIIMPKLDGFGVLDAMREDDELKDIPVIMLTNLGQVTDVDRAKTLGVVDYIVKSDTTLETVIKKIREYTD
ncbi:response regulator [Candidatus Uhrbacteria bacterium]|jgi:two-component system, OmpR family, response regulator RpaB|nr:response regulator [Candidatus Uhrbacteria bacterium]